VFHIFRPGKIVVVDVDCNRKKIVVVDVDFNRKKIVVVDVDCSGCGLQSKEAISGRIA
jgi:hypothetical protein